MLFQLVLKDAPRNGNDSCARLNNLFLQLRMLSPYYQSVAIYREGEPQESIFFRLLIEVNFLSVFLQYLSSNPHLSPSLSIFQDSLFGGMGLPEFVQQINVPRG